MKIARRSAKSSDKRASFQVIYPYQFCGPDTRLMKSEVIRINPLDATYREHDIAYSRHAAYSQNNDFTDTVNKAIAR